MTRRKPKTVPAPKAFGPITLRRGDVFVVGLRWNHGVLHTDHVANLANEDEHAVLGLGYQLRMRLNPIRQVLMVLPKGTTAGQVDQAIGALTHAEQQSLWDKGHGTI